MQNIYEKAKKQQVENEARYNLLKGQKKALEKQQQELAEEAQAKYGTADIQALREKYKTLNRELENAVTAYAKEVEENTALLDKIEQGLKDIS